MSLDDVIAKFQVEYGTAGTAPVSADVPAAPLQTLGGTAGTAGTAKTVNSQDMDSRTCLPNTADPLVAPHNSEGCPHRTRASHVGPGGCLMRSDVPHAYGLEDPPRALPEDGSVHKSCRMSAPSRTPFNAVCMQGGSAAEIRAQWPGATVAPIRP